MKRITALFLMLLVFMTVLPPEQVAAASKRYAKLTAFEGAVIIKKNGGDKGFKAFNGMSLSEGDSIETGVGSSATLEIDKERTVRIADNTKVDLTELKGNVDQMKSNMKLWGGKVYVEIDKKLGNDERFNISTPTAVMGVRGTKFYVGYSPDGGVVVGVRSGSVSAAFYTFAPSATGESTLSSFETAVEPGQELTVPAGAAGAGDVTMQEVALENLPAFILEAILENPGELTAEELTEIQAVYDTRVQEEQQQIQQQLQQLQTIVVPEIIYTPPTTPPSPPTGGGGGGGATTPAIAVTGTGLVDNVTMAWGQELQRYFNVNPIDAQVSVTSSNSDVVYVSRGESPPGSHYFRLTATGAGTATVTVTVTKAGYTSYSQAFTVTVQGLFVSTKEAFQDALNNNVPVIVLESDITLDDEAEMVITRTEPLMICSSDATQRTIGGQGFDLTFSSTAPVYFTHIDFAGSATTSNVMLYANAVFSGVGWNEYTAINVANGKQLTLTGEISNGTAVQTNATGIAYLAEGSTLTNGIEEVIAVNGSAFNLIRNQSTSQKLPGNGLAFSTKGTMPVGEVIRVDFGNTITILEGMSGDDWSIWRIGEGEVSTQSSVTQSGPAKVALTLESILLGNVNYSLLYANGDGQNALGIATTGDEPSGDGAVTALGITVLFSYRLFYDTAVSTVSDYLTVEVHETSMLPADNTIAEGSVPITTGMTVGDFSGKLIFPAGSQYKIVNAASVSGSFEDWVFSDITTGKQSDDMLQADDLLLVEAVDGTLRGYHIAFTN